MEQPHLGTLKSCVGSLLPLPPYRRSHLKSDTYRTMVRILSHCYDQSHLSNVTQIVNEQLIPGSACNEKIEKGTYESDQLPSHDNNKSKSLLAWKGLVADEGFEDIGFPNSGFTDKQRVIDELECIMDMEEDGDFPSQKDVMVSDRTEGACAQNGGGNQEKVLIDELENIIRGNEELVRDVSINLLPTLLEEIPGENEVVALANNSLEHIDFQHFLVEESVNPVQNVQVQVGNDDYGPMTLEDLPYDGIMTSKTSDAVELIDEIQQKEIGAGKPACTGNRMGSPSPLIEEGEIEEGEIEGGGMEKGENSGDYNANGIMIDVLLEDDIVLKEIMDEEQVLLGTTDKNEFTCNNRHRFKENSSEQTGGEVLLKEGFTNAGPCMSENVTHGSSKMNKEANMYNCAEVTKQNRKRCAGEDGVYPNNPLPGGEIIEQTATGTQEITSKENQNTGVCNKKKRSTSKEAKAKKKQKERKKRAEKNRQLGVKRLKLQPVSKPKTVTYCRHFLYGRCHEADKCKFSHDTIPLTKSRPCSHFARRSCMKGDDCPFDHQLSKYPCSNYAAHGFCSRGDDCLFSHQMPIKEDAQQVSNAQGSVLNVSTLATNSTSKKLPNINRVSCQNVNSTGRVSANNCTGQNVAKNALETPAVANKNISCLFVEKSIPAESVKHNRKDLSSKRNENGKVNQVNNSTAGTVQKVNLNAQKTSPAVAPKGINFLPFGEALAEPSAVAAKGVSGFPYEISSTAKSVEHNQKGSSFKRNECGRVNQTRPSASGTGQNRDITPQKTPPMEPKGINFLSFGKALSVDSSSKKLASFPLNEEEGIKLPQHNNFTGYEQASSSHPGVYGVKLTQTLSSVSSTIQNPIQQLNEAQPAVAPSETDSLSFRKPVVEDSRSNGEASLPSSSCNGMVKSVQGSHSASLDLPASPLALCQSSGGLVNGHYKSTPNSARKTLLSTLAFAAKFESKKNTNCFPITATISDSPNINEEKGNSSIRENLQNHLAKTSNILKFSSGLNC